MRCLIKKYDIEDYKQELVGGINSNQDLRDALNTVARNLHSITKDDARVMLNIILMESRNVLRN